MSGLRGVLLAAVMTSTLPACVPLVATGVGVGVAATLDRRSYGIQVEDSTIEGRASNRIAEKLGPSARVAVTSFNRMVLLSGDVPSEAAKAEAAAIAGAMLQNPIRGLHNELVVRPRASLTAITEDVATTSSVKSRMLGAKGFSGNQVKIVTEYGTVYLMGMLTTAEATAATDVAATTRGVRRVVQLFEIITPEQARALDQPGAAESTPPTPPRSG